VPCIIDLCAGQAAWPTRIKGRARSASQWAITDREGTLRQEVDGRATDRQLQRADRQARKQATIQHLPACSVGMIGDNGATGRTGTTAQRDPAPSPALAAV